MKHWLKQLFGKNNRRPLTRDRRKPSTKLRLEELETRLVPTVQFTAASETVAATAGTFSIPVTQTGTVTPTVTTFATGLGNGLFGEAFDAAGNLYVGNANTSTLSKSAPAGMPSPVVPSG